MIGILQALEELIRSNTLSVVDSVDLPARDERRLAVPPEFATGKVGQWLQSTFAKDGCLWRHQSLALQSAAEGHNVVLATGTASGKSLVFHATALRLLEADDDARVLAFYPMKALASDQLIGWRHAASRSGHPANAVAEITGSVLVDERMEAIRSARIVAMTPDVCQAWLLHNAAVPAIRQFLASVRLLILDEVHVLDAVFGSHVAFLIRRLQAVRHAARRDKARPLQVIAASATISNASEHLEALTGLPAAVIGEAEDGSPSHPRRLLHVAADHDIRQVAVDTLRELLQRSQHGSFIAFADSRQGVERIARNIDDDRVRPYRSGYEVEDRRSVEDALRNAKLRGVVSTSALELGINIPHFAFGLNIDVPSSRKSLRQRIGRVGRTQLGVFAVLADPLAFRRLGSTFREYWEGSVEPAHLYLANRFMQFAHARCLVNELESLGIRAKTPPASVAWPLAFAEIFDLARPGGARPPEFDPIHQLGGDEPHFNYPLRAVGEPSFNILTGSNGTGRIGQISLQQAIREAYPGAIYLHMTRGYRVFEWRNTAFDRTIRVGSKVVKGVTKPIIRTLVNAALDRTGIVAGHYLSSDKGFQAECQLQINERVEGYEERGQRKIYKDLRLENPGMIAKTRDFRTTGVVLSIEADWFRAPGVKQQLASALRNLIFREYSIASQDMDVAATNIAYIRDGHRVAAKDTIVVFDATYGSLRLTEPVFSDLSDLLDKLARAATLVGKLHQPPVPAEIVDRLREWLQGLDRHSSLAEKVVPVPADGWLRVLKPGSRVARRDSKNILVDIEIIEPLVMSVMEDQPPRLHYRYRPAGFAQQLIVHHYAPETAIEKVGEDWEEVLWNPTINQYIDGNNEPTVSLVG